MPIKTLSETSVTQVCALCGAENTTAINALVLGQSRGEADPDLVTMPPCPTAGCGTIEVFKRTWDRAPERYAATPFYQQRLAVNALAQLLLEANKTDPGCAALHAAEDVAPPQMLARDSLRGAGHAPSLPDMSVGRRMWLERTTDSGDVHPALRRKTS